eukprot:CAMPEP_0184447172 /NCGR_PEP_ID=MMETSP0740-20130409/3482_1 /TAXON_ID=385413 /ORGANISM="Thalassiosira miniscula, Strain CCMP1093" /LENGTH=695 /DNA_ID=CAMNT_0026816735 /DNA_START=63 /DNA_END=2150 /DNA_ORIENTATION=+
MLTYPIATTLFLLGQGVASAKTTSRTLRTRKVHPLKPSFLRLMDGHNKHARRLMSNKKRTRKLIADSEQAATLRKKMFEKGTMIKEPGTGRKLQNYNYGNYNNANNNAGNDDANDANGYNANAGYNQYSNAYAQNNAENNQKQYKYDQYKDGADDYFQGNGDWENIFGFDPTQFSASYHRCAAVRQYDDEIAAMEDTDSVFATKNFAVFRFCPAQTCMGWQEQEDEWECDEDTYGEEYCEAMEEYMEQQQENAENYQENGSGWNGYNQNGGADQANNYMNVNGYYGGQAYEEQEGGQAYEEQEEEEQYGAQGEGCQNNYGEYMMEMEEFLNLMLEWQEERFEQYCMYCEECMFDVYEAWLENGGDNRKLSLEEFKDSEEHRKLGNNYYNVCPEYDTCQQYQKVCQGGVNDGYSEYFECTEAEQGNNGQIAYIGPHCAEDGYTITLGLYSDEYCNEYIGNGADISNFLGEDWDPEEDALHSYYNSAYGTTLDQLNYINEDNLCIPCTQESLMWTERGAWNGDDDDGNYGGSNEINDLCEMLYEDSARCDKHFRSYNTRSKRAKYAEAVAQEDLTCDFIDSIAMGNYNEMGEIDVGDNYQIGQAAWMRNNMYAQQYGHYVSEVTPLQIFGLIMSILAVILLGMWSSSLHRSLTKAGPWRPRRGFRSPAPANTAADLNRQNSGIVMGRSESNTSYYMT